MAKRKDIIKDYSEVHLFFTGGKSKPHVEVKTRDQMYGDRQVFQQTMDALKLTKKQMSAAKKKVARVIKTLKSLNLDLKWVHGWKEKARVKGLYNLSWDNKEFIIPQALELEFGILSKDVKKLDKILKRADVFVVRPRGSWDVHADATLASKLGVAFRRNPKSRKKYPSRSRAASRWRARGRKRKK